MENSIEKFITEGHFVNPEKLEAVKVFGLKKAKEIFAQKEQNTCIIDKLRYRACLRALLPLKKS